MDTRVKMLSSMASTMSLGADDREQFVKGNSHPEIAPSEIEMGELLGSGSFSKVYKGKCRGQDVAVKVSGRRARGGPVFFSLLSLNGGCALLRAAGLQHPK